MMVGRTGRGGRLALEALGGARVGRVVSVHRRVVNIVVDDGALVGLLVGRRLVHPWAVSVDMDLKGVGLGGVVEHVGDELSLGALSIDLGRLEAIDLRLPAGAIESGALESRTDDALSPAEQQFWETRDARSLIGLGPGLTPSGDDMLIGALAGLELLGRSHPELAARRAAIVRSIPVDLDAITPKLSAQLLRAAVAGEYPEPLVDLVAALLLGERRVIDGAVERVLAIGAQSGRDTLRGFTQAVGLEPIT